MNSEAKPQVKEQALWTPTNSVRQKVFGYTFDHEDKLAWAEKNNVAPEKRPHIRIQIVRKMIAKQLPKEYRRLAVVHDRTSPVMCLVIGNNMTTQEIAKTKDPAVLQMFQKVMGAERKPKWFRQI